MKFLGVLAIGFAYVNAHTLKFGLWVFDAYKEYQVRFSAFEFFSRSTLKSTKSDVKVTSTVDLRYVRIPLRIITSVFISFFLQR